MKLLLTIVILVASIGDVQAGVITVVGDTGDGTVDVNGLPQDLGDPLTRVGVGGNNLRGLATIYFFELPTLSSFTTITNAQLQIEYLGISPSSSTTTPEFNADLFGIDSRPDATIQASDYYDGDASLNADTLILESVFTSSTATGNVDVANLSLVNFVDSLYNANGTPVSAFAAFRINPDKDLPVGSGAIRGFDVAMADNANASFRPLLNLTTTTVPEPSSIALLAIGAIGFIGYRRRKRKLAA